MIAMLLTGFAAGIAAGAAAALILARLDGRRRGRTPQTADGAGTPPNKPSRAPLSFKDRRAPTRDLPFHDYES